MIIAFNPSALAEGLAIASGLFLLAAVVVGWVGHVRAWEMGGFLVSMYLVLAGVIGLILAATVVVINGLWVGK